MRPEAGSLHSADSGRDDTKKEAEVLRGVTQADRYCLGAGISVPGVPALSLSRRDKHRADPSAKLRAGSLLGQVEVRKDAVATVFLFGGRAGARGRKPGSLHSADSGRDDTKKDSTLEDERRGAEILRFALNCVLFVVASVRRCDLFC